MCLWYLFLYLYKKNTTIIFFYVSGFPGEQVQLSKSSNASSSHPQSPSSRVFSSPSRPMDSSGSPSKNCRPSMVTQKQLIKQSPISSVYDSQIGSQEEIVERAKQVLFLECFVILLKVPSFSSCVLYIQDVM